jgi:hypothetical protein
VKGSVSAYIDIPEKNNKSIPELRRKEPTGAMAGYGASAKVEGGIGTAGLLVDYHVWLHCKREGLYCSSRSGWLFEHFRIQVSLRPSSGLSVDGARVQPQVET